MNLSYSSIFNVTYAATKTNVRVRIGRCIVQVQIEHTRVLAIVPIPRTKDSVQRFIFVLIKKY